MSETVLYFRYTPGRDSVDWQDTQTGVFTRFNTIPGWKSPHTHVRQYGELHHWKIPPALWCAVNGKLKHIRLGYLVARLKLIHRTTWSGLDSTHQR